MERHILKIERKKSKLKSEKATKLQQLVSKICAQISVSVNLRCYYLNHSRASEVLAGTWQS